MAARPETLVQLDDVYENALGILQERFRDDLTVEEVALELYVSKRQLQRAFEGRRTSFSQQLARFRFERAAEMLLRSPLQVKEVARAVGYSQPAQFSKAFRRHHGRSPVEWRSATPS